MHVKEIRRGFTKSVSNLIDHNNTIKMLQALPV